ncbi:nucleolin 2-like [Helianthus annuus]|uniref:nucleolin 2-like n=1 Tax=Helianthus annuus TaxID=4232 RepID=UPI000B8FA4FA|nr:nucleolin 2-like [Helianthus annuus]
MYPRFIMMLINDKFKDLPKNRSYIMDVRNVTTETIARVTKEDDERMKQMICKISNPAYVAPENDKWRHENSDSDNENEKMSELKEKNTRWWVEKEKGKRKRTPKTSPAVSIPKIVEKGPSVEPQQRLIDETVLEPSVVIEQGADLLKQTLESYLKRKEEAAAQKDQGSSAQAENVKEPEGEVQDDSSEDDSEATLSESELDPTTLGRGKVQLKKKPTKKQKASDEEDSSYEPDQPKKQIKKRKAIQAGVIPRSVRAKKSGAEPPKDKGGKKEKHLQKSNVHEAEKDQSVEIPKEPEAQNIEVPVVEVQKKTRGDDDYVEITGYKAATPPRPPPQDQPESSHPKDTKFDYIFEGLLEATGIYTEDIPEDDYDMFNNEAVNELLKKVADLEKAKAKAEKERDILKQRVEQLMKAHDQIRMVLINQEETMNKMKNEAHDNSKVVELLTAEISSLNVKIKNLEDVNQTLNQLLSEMMKLLRIK